MKSFKKIYCVIKTSGLEILENQGKKKELFQGVPKHKHEQLIRSDQNQKSFLKTLKSLDKEYKIGIIFIKDLELEKISPEKSDLIMSCGGDGTFLSCAQMFTEHTLLGLNSDHQDGDTKVGSYGALTRINCKNLESRMIQFIYGKFKIEAWRRLQVSISGRPIYRLAVNEIYFGQKLSYHTCEITVEVSGRSEDFQCSGIITSTGMGSHAWFQNAGGSPFSNELDAFGFQILIPNIKRPLEFSSGVISSTNTLMIYPNRNGYILCFDSKDEVIETRIGDIIEISLAKNAPVKVVTFLE